MFRKTGLLLLGLLLLQSCSWSLRGSDVLSSQFTAIDLAAEQPNSDLVRLLRRSLEVANVNLDSGPNAAPRLIIGPEIRANRPVSVNPRARAAQYEVRISVTIALDEADTILIPPQTLVVERSYFEDTDNIVGNQEEVEIILEEMRRDLVNQIMRRLEAGA